ncbi:site-specific integrase [Lachnospiraceae bacterium 29-84]
MLLGLGRCEINGVKYSDIDYINRTLKVQRQLGKKPNTTAEDFPAKTFTKQEIGLKTPSSYRTIPIPDYVFEAILEERKVYEKNRRRRSGTFQDLDYICCSTYGRPRSKDFHWRHYKKLLEDNGLPDIRWHDLRSTFCTILLKNNFNPKAVSQLMGHAKEIITIDVYGDTAETLKDTFMPFGKIKEIIEDCLDDLQPFIDEVILKEESESGTDFSQDNYIEQISEFLA